jgi:hypothetical protein
MSLCAQSGASVTVNTDSEVDDKGLAKAREMIALTDRV